MNAKYFLIGFFAFNMLASGVIVLAADYRATYDLGVYVGSRQTYEVIKDEDNVEAEGKQFTLEVLEISSSSAWGYDIWKVKMKETNWEGESKTVFRVTKTPPYGDDFYLYLCPVPVADYLADIADNLASTYDGEESGPSASGTNFTSFGTSGRGLWRTKYSYDAKTGWLNHYIRTLNGVTKTELVALPTDSTIPGHNLPLILSIAGITTIGIAYTMIKKRSLTI